MKLVVRRQGLVDYRDCLRAMQQFTDRRGPETDDEFWCVQHPAVFTLGRAARREHLLAPGDIPVVETDRGGQVTYHGPGQVVVYTLLDVRRLAIGPRELVKRIEQGVLDYLSTLAVIGARRPGAPGVYVEGRKIAALGLRIRRGCSFHGVALNVAMALEPFTRINPCGYAGLEVIDLAHLGVTAGMDDVHRGLVTSLGRAVYAGQTPTTVFPQSTSGSFAEEPLTA